MGSFEKFLKKFFKPAKSAKAPWFCRFCKKSGVFCAALEHYRCQNTANAVENGIKSRQRISLMASGNKDYPQHLVQHLAALAAQRRPVNAEFCRKLLIASAHFFSEVDHVHQVALRLREMVNRSPYTMPRLLRGQVSARRRLQLRNQIVKGDGIAFSVRVVHKKLLSQAVPGKESSEPYEASGTQKKRRRNRLGTGLWQSHVNRLHTALDSSGFPRTPLARL